MTSAHIEAIRFFALRRLATVLEAGRLVVGAESEEVLAALDAYAPELAEILTRPDADMVQTVAGSARCYVRAILAGETAALDLIEAADARMGFGLLWANGTLRGAADVLGVTPAEIDGWARDAARRVFGRAPARMTPPSRVRAAWALLAPAALVGDLRACRALLGALGQDLGWCELPEETLAALVQEVHP